VVDHLAASALNLGEAVGLSQMCSFSRLRWEEQTRVAIASREKIQLQLEIFARAVNYQKLVRGLALLTTGNGYVIPGENVNVTAPTPL